MFLQHLPSTSDFFSIINPCIRVKIHVVPDLFLLQMTIKQFGHKPPDSFVEGEKSSASSSLAPGFIRGVAFFNLKSKI
jgi:hypothetical protein